MVKIKMLCTCFLIITVVQYVSTQFSGPTLACGATSLLKTTTLITPKQSVTSCLFTIRAINLRVCQLRIDFNTFILAPPTVDPYPKCVNDVLSIGNLDFDLCGENTNQHLYVPFNPTNANRNLQISFTLMDRNINTTLINPFWNMRVQQIECPAGSGYYNRMGVGNMMMPDMGIKTLNSDLNMLAPPGCTQYFSSPTGVIESFNLGSGVGPYIGNTNYAICFKRMRKNTELILIPTIFSLGYGTIKPNENEGYDSSCFSNVATIGLSEDHLFIPNAVTDAVPKIRASKFCARSILSHVVKATPPGPFVINFNSDTVYEGDAKPEIGFRIQYEII